MSDEKTLYEKLVTPPSEELLEQLRKELDEQFDDPEFHKQAAAFFVERLKHDEEIIGYTYEMSADEISGRVEKLAVAKPDMIIVDDLEEPKGDGS